MAIIIPHKLVKLITSDTHASRIRNTHELQINTHLALEKPIMCTRRLLYAKHLRILKTDVAETDLYDLGLLRLLLALDGGGRPRSILLGFHFGHLLQLRGRRPRFCLLCRYLRLLRSLHVTTSKRCAFNTHSYNTVTFSSCTPSRKNGRVLTVTKQ